MRTSNIKPRFEFSSDLISYMPLMFSLCHLTSILCFLLLQQYENQMNVLGKWLTRGLPRPAFSSARGDVSSANRCNNDNNNVNNISNNSEDKTQTMATLSSWSETNNFEVNLVLKSPHKTARCFQGAKKNMPQNNGLHAKTLELL